MNALELLLQKRGNRTSTIVRGVTRMAFGPMDHEIYNNRMVYQVLNAGVRVDLNPGTGEFASIATVFDTEVADIGQSQNGPEFGADANGEAIFYCRADASGWYQIWRATISQGGSVTTTQLTTTPHHKVNILSTTDVTRSSTLIAYVAGGYVRVVDEDTPNDAQNVTFALSNQTASMRWAQGSSKLLACKGEQPDRGAIIEWSNGVVRTCTPGTTEILYDPYGFYCPELGKNVAVVTVGPGFAGRSLRLFEMHPTNSWPVVGEIPFPEEAAKYALRYMYSVEPVVASGKTYFLLTLTDRVGWISVDVTSAQVWLCSLNGQWVRVDGWGAFDKKHELESYYTEGGKLWLYWNEIAPDGVWLWRAEVTDAP